MIRNKKSLLASLLLLLFCAVLNAPTSLGDELVLRSGETITCSITSSSTESVTIRLRDTDSVTMRLRESERIIAHSQVDRYRFTSADIVLMPAGDAKRSANRT